ncbi:clindamycin resistance transfer factor BtgB [Phocaeicola dorei]|nr:clindamycin resistance transfer factor BtgB [Phocaeicola dorei]
MHIDFAPPSNGTYNNAGSSRQLANYMEHEDLERMEKGVYTEGFFNLTEDNIYKSKVIKDIDSNIGQLLKTDAKFYAIHVSPSESELRAMGNTEQEKAEAMKLYIREVFIPEYAKNFNKGLSETDIKFYGKIHFDRNRSDNELNMHCHLIISRKDQTNKKKLSPLTNHKNTKSGIIKGGFDRLNLFQQVEQGFDKLFFYNRIQTESFDYYNRMKNYNVSDQLNMQEQLISDESRMNTDEKIELNEHKQDNSVVNQQSASHDNKKKNNQCFNLSKLDSSYALSLFAPIPEKQEIFSKRKKKKPKQAFKR